MITLTEIFVIIIIHWVADFVFQDEKWALGKSKNWKDLLAHTSMYSYIWLILGIVLLFKTEYSYLFGNWDLGKILLFKILSFTIITFLLHTITDYFTSRIVSKKFAKQEYGSEIPNFGAFTIIGIDQVLHYIQLFWTYSILKGL